MVSFLLALGAFIGLAGAVVTFIFNSQTPMQLGPVPFFGGAGLFVICTVALIARHVVWR